jgi:glycosyltransferase involved in cell wall biosynthesis
MVRVAVVIEALGRGGAERLLVDTARLIDRSRFDLRVVTLHDVRRDYAPALAVLGVSERSLRLPQPPGLISGTLRLGRLLAEERIDVVHTHLYWANVVGRLAAGLNRIPVVSSYHDADYEPVVREGNPGLTRTKQAVLRVVDRVSAKLSHCQSVAVSDYVARSLHRRLGYPPARVTVIANAVDTDVFRPDDALRMEARRALTLDANDLMVLSVGRMTPQKGQEILVRALSSPDLQSARLVLVGGGDREPRLRELVGELGLTDRVTFLGTRGDVPQLMRAADLLSLPSLHEGFGLVLVEALASGTPVVASRVGPVPEIVLDGETGLLVEPSDPAGLAKALARLLQNRELRLRMGQRGRQDAVARFNLPRMVHSLEQLYLGLAQPEALRPG